ncbi:putative bifunctional diguanylate cyclase/phosphodiesterase [Shewanella polaris]|uniref:cyclic-guanylate-specific phosphodiesterase n=1 Tax=Shewanella polaris TaxID=2588449 RepID=A0A4Y5YEF9_9GAMM|nr:EAL domain-containing protein [Shewanella polaris]QDE30906.1 EAL domain-containing protein [Shewanella polaris]
MLKKAISQAKLREWQLEINDISAEFHLAIIFYQFNAENSFEAICTSHSIDKKTQLLHEASLLKLVAQHHSEKSAKQDTLIFHQLLRSPQGHIIGVISFSAKNIESSQVPLFQPLTIIQTRIANMLSNAIRYQINDLDVDAKGSVLLDINLQSFIDAFDEHIWVKDTLGQYVVCNKSVELAWQKTKQQIVGKTDIELFDQRTADEFLEGDNLAINAGKTVVVSECQEVDIDFNKVWIETIKSPIRNAQGDLSGVIGMTRNIAKHKEAEEQLVLAANVFQNAVEGVVITDREGNITEINQAFTDITGYSREEVLGQNPRMLNSGRHPKIFFERLWNTLLVQGKWHGEIWNRRKHGAIFPQSITISAVYDKLNFIQYYVAVFADISAQKQNEEKLKNLAYFDPLTQLPNRMQFMSLLEQEVNHAHRAKKQLAIIFLDIDFFKQINDSLGHMIGDEILIELAKRLSYALSDFDVLSRLSGDEFSVMIPSIMGTDSVTLSVDRIRSVFERPFILDNSQSVRLTASMGIAIYPSDGDDQDSLLRNADAAMHRAKLNGRNNYAFYTESMTKQAVVQLKLQTALHQALVNKDFYLVYQPKLTLSDLTPCGFEALIRWSDPVLGNIPPGEFIPLAEKIGLIWDIGLWVLKTACIQGVEWLTQGKTFERISVNVASLQLQRNDFVDKVRSILLETGLPAKHLELEVTESCMMQDPDAIIRDLKLLGAMGIALSIDDFGTGYSSLNYIKKLPIDKLKIDQSFVRDIPHDPNNTAIAKAVIALGHALNLQIIAEGVETAEQADFLRLHGCDLVQGYLFSKPRLPEELNDFLPVFTQNKTI